MTFARALHLLVGGGCVALFIASQLYLGWRLAAGAGYGWVYLSVIAVGIVAALLAKFGAKAAHR